MALLLLLLLIPLAVLFYYLAVRSRRSYQCPECGEEIRVEYLNAKRCGMCGAPLEKTEM